MKKRKLTATTPYGPVYRTTARSYTHVVVARTNHGQGWGSPTALAWSGSRQRAEAMLKHWRRRLPYRFDLSRVTEWELSIHPVDREAELEEAKAPRCLPPDVLVENHGSVALVRPLNDAAEQWLRERTSGDAAWFAGALVAEPRYLGGLVAGLVGDGWEVR